MLKAALFIDAANVFYAQRTIGWDIDFEKVYRYFEQHFALYNGFYYAAEPPAEEDERRVEYQRFSLIGYTMRLKPLKEIRDNKGKIVLKKANLDIEMVVDMFATQANYDMAILFTGDSDFTRAVELLRMNGKQILVFSTKGHSGMELINASDKFVDYVDMKEVFMKDSEDDKGENKTQKKTSIKNKTIKKPLPKKNPPNKSNTKKDPVQTKKTKVTKQNPQKTNQSD